MSGGNRNSSDGGRKKSGEQQRKRRSLELEESAQNSQSSDSSENEVEFRAFRRPGSNTASRPNGSSGNGGNGATGGTYYSGSNSNSMGKNAGARMRVGGPRLGGLGLGGISNPNIAEKKEEIKKPRKIIPIQSAQPLPDDFPLRPTPSVNPFPVPSINEPTLSSKKSMSNLSNRPFLSPELPVTVVRSSAFALDRPVPEAGLRITPPPTADLEEILLPEYGFDVDSEEHDSSFENKLFGDGDGFDGLTAALAEGGRGGEGIESSPMDPTPPTVRPRFPEPLTHSTDDETGDDSMEFLSPSTSLASISSNYSTFPSPTAPSLQTLPTTPKLLSVAIIRNSPGSDSEDYASPAEENPYRTSTGSEDTVTSDITTTTDSSGPLTPPSLYPSIFDVEEPAEVPIVRILNQDVMEAVGIPHGGLLSRSDSNSSFASSEVESMEAICGVAVSIPSLLAIRAGASRGPPPPRPKRMRLPIGINSPSEGIDLGGGAVRTRGLFSEGNDGYIEDDGGGGGSAGVRNYEKRTSYAQRRSGIEMIRNSFSGSGSSGERSTPPAVALPALPTSHQLDQKVPATIEIITSVKGDEEGKKTARPSPELPNSPASFVSESSYGEQEVDSNGKTDESFFYRAPPIRTSNSFVSPPIIPDPVEVVEDEVEPVKMERVPSKDLKINTKPESTVAPIISPTSSTFSLESPVYGSTGSSYFGLGLRLPSSLTPSSSLGSSASSNRSSTPTIPIFSPVTPPNVSPRKEVILLLPISPVESAPIPIPLTLEVELDRPPSPPSPVVLPVVKSVPAPIEIQRIPTPPPVILALPPVVERVPIFIPPTAPAEDVEVAIVESVSPSLVLPPPISSPIIAKQPIFIPVTRSSPVKVVEAIPTAKEEDISTPAPVVIAVEPLVLPVIAPVVQLPILPPPPVIIAPLLPTPIKIEPIPVLASTSTAVETIPLPRQRTLSATAASAALSGSMMLGYGAWKGISTAAAVGSTVSSWGWKKMMEVREDVGVIEEGEREKRIPGAFGGESDSGSEEEEEFFSEGEGELSAVEEEEEEIKSDLEEIDFGEERSSQMVGIEAEWDEGFPAPEGFLEDLKRAMEELGPEDLALDEKLELEAQQAAYESATRQHIEADEETTSLTSLTFPSRPSVKRSGSVTSTGTLTNRLREEFKADEEELEELADLISGGRLDNQEWPYVRGENSMRDSPSSTRSLSSSISSYNEPLNTKSSLFGFGSSSRRRVSDNGSIISSFSSTTPSLERSYSATSSGSGGTASSVMKKRNSIFGSKPLASVESDIGDATYVSYSSGKSNRRVSNSTSISGASITSRDSSSSISTKKDRRSSLRRDTKYPSSPSNMVRSASTLSEETTRRKPTLGVRFANASAGLGLREISEAEAERSGGDTHRLRWIGVGRGNRYGNLTIVNSENGLELDREYATQALKIKNKFRAFGTDRNWSEVRVD